MGGEKQSSKSRGGYVGGFLQLFDWNAKSRKKLFSSKSDLPEQSKQKKRSDGNLPMNRFNLIDEDEHIAGSSIKGSSDYSRASSVTDEEGHGTKPPSVIARLMGLDSLPTSNPTDPFFIPFFDSQSLQHGHYHRRTLQFHDGHQTMHSGNLPNKLEVPVKKAVEPKLQKMISSPIQKFQSEVLPPKSAKSIPVTHHKLLSPIKSPCFVPHKNAAHIMEAAAKIIEPGPPAVTKSRMPLLGTSSVHLKVRDLKEKLDASDKFSGPAEAFSFRRPVESNPAKFLKGQAMNKSCNRSEECSSVKGKGKSVSLALQAKVNVQKREGLNTSGCRNSFGQKEQGEIMPSQPFKSQTNSQRSTQKKPAVHNTSSVLRQNNQKQNCLNGKEKLLSKSSNSKGRKKLSGDSSLALHKNSSRFGGSSKVGAKKLRPEVADKMEVSDSSIQNISRKKRSIDGNFHLDKNLATDRVLVNKTEKPVQPDAVVDIHFNGAEDSKRKGIDVISFTFTAPMTRSAPSFVIPRLRSEEKNKFSAECEGEVSLNNTNSTTGSFQRYNVIGADALSTLLEQKLRELTHGAEPSCYRPGIAGNSGFSFQELEHTPKAVLTTPISNNKKSKDELYGSNSSAVNPLGHMTKHKFQVREVMDDCGGDELLRHPSPISVLEPSFSTESCNSSESAYSNSTEGNKQCSSSQAQEVLGVNSSKKSHLVDTDADLSDSASSTSARAIARRNGSALSMAGFLGSTRWELDYVKAIMFNVDWMFKSFTLGQARETINPRLFDQLESRKEFSESEGEEPKLRRKLLFDCVSECMDLRYRPCANGGCRIWAKGLSTLRRKEWLAEEVYKEISGWSSIGGCLVDDVVGSDMASRHGKWLDFEVEAFELGVEIGGQMLESLVSELVADILLL
ncbi:uncharacterized protein LOC127799241 [Diospyros lotus]|uniref:uncharacterized protein LOC127799241 n=1 Tax=Diospyros lotus TaxID=55363 RepID=UPI00225A1179|nr:uncharacterized protein LOC127799241 [Diospyros lotus]